LQTVFGDVALKRDSTVVDNSLVTSKTIRPIVHQLNPGSVAGVIPIAIGNDTNAASTNPKPTVSSSGANSTTFSTLNYTQGVNDTSATSTIQQRIETEVAACVCQGGSSNPFGTDDDTLLGHSTFRPTYWDGTSYVEPEAVVGGVPSSSAVSSINQSEQCDICCRDHSDVGIASGEVKYDSVTGDANRYQVSTAIVKGKTAPVTPIQLAGSVGSRVVADTSADIYLDACRMIRVDGLWRVATDIEASHLGLIATNDEMGTSINPGTPDSTKQTAYTLFVTNAVKAYLNAALPSAGSPAWVTFLTNTLASLFSDQSPDVPSTTPVLASTDGTYRYLHAHGLYIDHLEQDAIDKLNAVMNSSCPATATDFPECLLAYLPFSTINVSGLTAWTDENDSSDQAGATPLGKTALQLGQGTSSSETCSSTTFFGGCVTGLNSGYAYATASIGHSNSGIANTIQVNPYEEVATNLLTAAQQFNVSNTSSSDLIYAQVTGPNVTPTATTTAGTTTVSFNGVINFPNYALNSAINTGLTWDSNSRNGPCTPNSGKKVTTPNPYGCTTTVSLTTPTTITVSGYNQAVTAAATTPKAKWCGGTNKSYDIPGIVCYKLKTVTLTTDAAGANAVPGFTYSSSTGGTSKATSETTALRISAANQLSNTYLNLTFEENGSALGTFACPADTTITTPVITAPTACQ
jgi:hypothetical protein